LTRAKNASYYRKVGNFVFFLRKGGPVTEAVYQGKLIRKLKRLFPGCVVLKNDPQYQQGILDLTLLWGQYWAMLEVKASPETGLRPNQRYFVEQLDAMSFAAFIFPENEEEVLFALQEAFASRGEACVS
jgi:hypothetical protein